MTANILRLSWLFEIWALCVSWITYDHLYYGPCLACWALFGSLLPAMCNRTSCAQFHELPQYHCGDNREGALFSWLHIYYAHLVFVRFEHSVCRGSLMTTYLYYAPCLACWVLFGSLVPATSNRTSCVQVHELPRSHCGDNRGAHCFHYCICITLVLFLWDLTTLCVADYLWPLILRPLA